MEIKIKNLERRERKRNEKKTTGTHTIELKNNNVLSGILILKSRKNKKTEKILNSNRNNTFLVFFSKSIIIVNTVKMIIIEIQSNIKNMSESLYKWCKNPMIIKNKNA